MSRGFNNNHEINTDVYGKFFSKLETKYIHPKNVRNYNGEKAVKTFDSIMNKYNVKYYDGDLEEFRMTIKYFYGMGFYDTDTAFYPDRVLGLNKQKTVEIKNGLTDRHHPSKIILEAQSSKATNPENEFFVYCDGDFTNDAKKMLSNCPYIDGIIHGPVELEQWVNSNFAPNNKKLQVKPYNFFK